MTPLHIRLLGCEVIYNIKCFPLAFSGIFCITFCPLSLNLRVYILLEIGHPQLLFGLIVGMTALPLLHYSCLIGNSVGVKMVISFKN